MSDEKISENPNLPIIQRYSYWEISRKPHTLIAAQPTRGLDIGATEYIHLRLLEQREEGTATLLISEDLDEIMTLSDRIAVLFEGEVMGIMDQVDATPEKLGLLMAGVVEWAPPLDFFTHNLHELDYFLFLFAIFPL